MQLSKDELVLIEDSLRQAKQIHLMLASQGKSRMDNAKEEFLHLLKNEKINKKNTARIDVLTIELDKHKKGLAQLEIDAHKFDALIKKVQSNLVPS